jgi:hypothetical protein
MAHIPVILLVPHPVPVPKYLARKNKIKTRLQQQAYYVDLS